MIHSTQYGKPEEVRQSPRSERDDRVLTAKASMHGVNKMEQLQHHVKSNKLKHIIQNEMNNSRAESMQTGIATLPVKKAIEMLKNDMKKDEIIDMLQQHMKKEELVGMLHNHIKKEELLDELDTYMSKSEVSHLLQDHMSKDELVEMVQQSMTKVNLVNMLQSTLNAEEMIGRFEHLLTDKSSSELLIPPKQFSEDVSQSELKDAFSEFSFNSDIKDLLENNPEKGRKIIADILKDVELDPEMYTKVEEIGLLSGESLSYDVLSEEGIEFFSNDDVGKAFLYDQYEQLNDSEELAVDDAFAEVKETKLGVELQETMSEILNDTDKLKATQWRNLGEVILMNTPPEELDSSLYNDVTISKHGSDDAKDWTYSYDLTDASMDLLLAIDELKPEETDVKTAGGTEFNLKKLILDKFEELPIDIKENLVAKLLETPEVDAKDSENSKPDEEK